jgi:23S rRNA (uracil1939-C5)-methyltransferase
MIVPSRGVYCEVIDEHLDRMTSLKNIFYISCNVDTFARDCGKLLALGFKVAKIQPVDMFPTPHVEVCAHLYR